jgi:hypothetical protein
MAEDRTPRYAGINEATHYPPQNHLPPAEPPGPELTSHVSQAAIEAEKMLEEIQDQRRVLQQPHLY